VKKNKSSSYQFASNGLSLFIEMRNAVLDVSKLLSINSFERQQTKKERNNLPKDILRGKYCFFDLSGQSSVYFSFLSFCVLVVVFCCESQR
jgi:hypothetical protein